MTAANKRLPGYARVGYYLRMPRPFTAATGELTANGRLRRQAIEAAHGEMIETIYKERRHAVLR